VLWGTTYILLFAIIGLFMTDPPTPTIDSPSTEVNYSFHYLLFMGFRRFIQHRKLWLQEKAVLVISAGSGLVSLLASILTLGARGALICWYAMKSFGYYIQKSLEGVLWLGAEMFCNSSSDFVELCSALQQVNEQSYSRTY
jgi:hypothetical protein